MCALILESGSLTGAQCAPRVSGPRWEREEEDIEIEKEEKEEGAEDEEKKEEGEEEEGGGRLESRRGGRKAENSEQPSRRRAYFPVPSVQLIC